MAFIIAAAIVAVVTVLVFIYFTNDGLYGFIGNALLSLFVGAITALVLFFVVYLVSQTVGWNATVASTDTYQLKSIGADSSIEGRFYYLGGGYIEGERVLNYVREVEDDTYQAGVAGADDSLIHEVGGVDPYMEEHNWVYDNGWIYPWKWDVGDTFDFYIPSGSVLENYEIGSN